MRRRYKDFEAFNDLMIAKYPYRLIPRMPPKKLTREFNLSSTLPSCGLHYILASPAFIEQRRRALKRYMVLLVRHPVLAKDEIVKVFLTAGGQVCNQVGEYLVLGHASTFQDVGTRLKEKYKVTADEFIFSTHAKHAQVSEQKGGTVWAKNKIAGISERGD